MKPIEEIDIGELRQAIKSLNDSGLHPDGKMKAIGAKENLIEEFTKRIEEIPEETTLPKIAGDFYHEVYVDEFEEPAEEPESQLELDAESKNEPEKELEEKDEPIDPEDDPENDELLLKPETETGVYEKKLMLSMLKKLQPAVDEHILFTPEDMIAFNGEICMKIPFFTDMSCVINLKDFETTLKKFPIKTFQMSFDKEKNELQLTGVGVRAGYISCPRINLIDSLEEVIDDSERIEWKKLPDDFLKGVDLVHFAASKNVKFGTAACLYVNEDELVATDRTRISHYLMAGKMGKFFVRASNIKYLKNLEPTGFGLTKNWIHFQNEHDYSTVSFRLMYGEFPNYKDLIDYEIMEKPIRLTKSFENMINMNQTMAKSDGTEKIYLNVSDTIKCRSSNERGWVETNINSHYDGPKFSFSTNPSFLIEAIKHGVTHMGLASEHTLALEAENFKHIVALLKEV